MGVRQVEYLVNIDYNSDIDYDILLEEHDTEEAESAFETSYRYLFMWYWEDVLNICDFDNSSSGITIVANIDKESSFME